MGEFMTQPLNGANALLLMATVIFAWTFLLWVSGLLWRKWSIEGELAQLWARVHEAQQEVDHYTRWRPLLDERTDNLVAQMDSMSDTLWSIEDDVERLRSPWWKRLARRIGE